MIKYTRIKLPLDLIEPSLYTRFSKLNAKQHTTYLLKKITQLKNNFAFNQLIEPALKDTFHSKCAYCERRINFDQGFSINLFRPDHNARDLKENYSKKHYWWLAIEWKNQYLSCPECDVNKGNWFPVEGTRANKNSSYNDLAKERALLLDPCINLVENEFTYNIAGQINSPSMRGKVTIDILKLNRSDLMRERRRSWNYEKIKFNTARQNPFTFATYLEEIFFKDEAEFLGIKRFFIKNYLLKHKFKNKKIKDITNRIIEKYKIGTFSTAGKGIGKSYDLKNSYITSILIKDFRNIKKLKIEIPQKNDSKQCLFLIGENGTGKSSILKAIALCLSNEEYNKKLQLSKDFSGSDKNSSIIIEYDSGGRSELTFINYNNKINLKYSSNSSKNSIIGYGSIRISSTTNNATAIENQKGVKLKNLFNPLTRIKNPISWLNKITRSEFESATSRLASILDLSDSSAISRRDESIFIKRGGKNINFDLLSDGNKVLFTMACDLMSSLNSKSGDFKDIEAIVLIDEIENHLHPRWKFRIIDQLRSTFPNIQFIISTHDPLCLKGACIGEVLLLREGNRGSLKAFQDLPNPKLLTAEQLLTSEYFGLNSTINPEIEYQFNRYYNLLSKVGKTHEDFLEIENLRSELITKGQFGQTLRDEIMYKVIDEVISAQFVGDKMKKRGDLNKEALEKIKSQLFKNI